MDTKYETEGGTSGLSTGHLLFVFLVGVAVCAVFFSLGFLVGYNERSLKEALISERVGPPPAVPPTVVTPPGGIPNPPPEVVPATPAGGMVVPAPLAGPGSAQVPPEAAKPAAAAVPAPARPSSAEGTSPRLPTTAGGTSPTSVAPGSELGVGITVQVAASRTREDADKMVEILKARGYPVFVVTPEYANAKDNLYRVQVGPFRSTEEAETVRAKLVQEGLKPFIRR